MEFIIGMTVERTARILIVGAGGIGGLAFDLIVPALEKVGQKCSITIMDGDIVEDSNLGHQRFSSNIAAGNIQFGYVNAAAAAATWIMGRLRNQPPLQERMSSIMFGELRFPVVKA